MCRTTNPGGGGSSPPVRANSSGCRGAWPSLPALEAGDRWFESTRPDQFDAVSSVGRAPLSESGCARFKSAICQSTGCPSGQGALCKSAHATLTPASRACAGLSHMDSAAQQAPQYLPLKGGGMESPPCDGAICDYPARTRGRVGCWSPSSSGSSGEAPIF
jgi:hypothetical protein